MRHGGEERLKIVRDLDSGCECLNLQFGRNFLCNSYYIWLLSPAEASISVEPLSSFCVC